MTSRIIHLICLLLVVRTDGYSEKKRQELSKDRKDSISISKWHTSNNFVKWSQENDKQRSKLSNAPYFKQVKRKTKNGEEIDANMGVLKTHGKLHINKNDSTREYYKTRIDEFANGSKREEVLEGNKMDLVFVVGGAKDKNFDVSGHYKICLALADSIAEKYDIDRDKVRVALVTYGALSKMTFDLQDYSNKELLKAAFMEAEYPGPGTETAQALDMVRLSVLPTGRQGPIAKVLVLITAGLSQDQAAKSAQQLKDDGVEIYTVGIGPEVDRRQLEAIASEPKDDHVFVTAFEDAPSVAGPLSYTLSKVKYTAESIMATAMQSDVNNNFGPKFPAQVTNGRYVPNTASGFDNRGGYNARVTGSSTAGGGWGNGGVGGSYGGTSAGSTGARYGGPGGAGTGGANAGTATAGGAGVGGAGTGGAGIGGTTGGWSGIGEAGASGTSVGGGGASAAGGGGAGAGIPSAGGADLGGAGAGGGGIGGTTGGWPGIGGAGASGTSVGGGGASAAGGGGAGAGIPSAGGAGLSGAGAGGVGLHKPAPGGAGISGANIGVAGAYGTSAGGAGVGGTGVGAAMAGGAGVNGAGAGGTGLGTNKGGAGIGGAGAGGTSVGGGGASGIGGGTGLGGAIAGGAGAGGPSIGGATGGGVGIGGAGASGASVGGAGVGGASAGGAIGGGSSIGGAGAGGADTGGAGQGGAGVGGADLSKAGAGGASLGGAGASGAGAGGVGGGPSGAVGGAGGAGGGSGGKQPIVLGGTLGALAALSALLGPNAGGLLGGAHQQLLQPINSAGEGPQAFLAPPSLAKALAGSVWSPAAQIPWNISKSLPYAAIAYGPLWEASLRNAPGMEPHGPILGSPLGTHGRLGYPLVVMPHGPTAAANVFMNLGQNHGWMGMPAIRPNAHGPIHAPNIFTDFHTLRNSFDALYPGIHAHGFAPVNWKLNAMLPRVPYLPLPNLVPGPSFVTQYNTFSYGTPHHTLFTSSGMPHINVIPHAAFATRGGSRMLMSGSFGFPMHDSNFMSRINFMPHGDFMSQEGLGFHHGHIAYPTYFGSGVLHLHEPAFPLLHPRALHGHIPYPTHFDSGAYHLHESADPLLFQHQHPFGALPDPGFIDSHFVAPTSNQNHQFVLEHGPYITPGHVDAPVVPIYTSDLPPLFPTKPHHGHPFLPPGHIDSQFVPKYAGDIPPLIPEGKHATAYLAPGHIDPGLVPNYVNDKPPLIPDHFAHGSALLPPGHIDTVLVPKYEGDRPPVFPIHRGHLLPPGHIDTPLVQFHTHDNPPLIPPMHHIGGGLIPPGHIDSAMMPHDDRDRPPLLNGLIHSGLGLPPGHIDPPAVFHYNSEGLANFPIAGGYGSGHFWGMGPGPGWVSGWGQGLGRGWGQGLGYGIPGGWGYAYGHMPIGFGFMGILPHHPHYHVLPHAPHFRLLPLIPVLVHNKPKPLSPKAPPLSPVHPMYPSFRPSSTPGNLPVPPAMPAKLRRPSPGLSYGSPETNLPNIPISRPPLAVVGTAKKEKLSDASKRNSVKQNKTPKNKTFRRITKKSRKKKHTFTSKKHGKHNNLPQRKTKNIILGKAQRIGRIILTMTKVSTAKKQNLVTKKKFVKQKTKYNKN